MQTRIVRMEWEEPEHGFSATVVALTPAEWKEFDEAVLWAENQHPDEVGLTFVKVTCEPSSHPAPHSTGVLEGLATDLRYDTGEGLYEDDCPVFARHGILRG